MKLKIQSKPFLLLYATILLAGVVILSFSARSAPADKSSGGTGPDKITWSVPKVAVIVPAGSSLTFPITFISQSALNDVQFEISPDLASVLTVQPLSFSQILPNRNQQASLIFSVSAQAATGTIDQTVQIRAKKKLILPALEVLVTVTSNSVALTIPPSFHLDQHIAAVGGPISLNNFSDSYVHGGFVPPGGAAIDVITVALPQISITNYATNELQGAEIASINALNVASTQATEVFYTESFGASASYSNIAVYVPIGQKLYKIYLTYHTGDPLESQFLSSFQQLLSTIQFTN